jgi:hypothetical protein
MRRLHFSILVLCGWFFAFYNVERIFEQVNLASFVYLLAPVLGMLVLSIPKLRRVPLYWYIPLSFVSVIILRSALGYGQQENAFSLCVTESLATWITLALSYQLGKGIDEYCSAATTAMVNHLADHTQPFEEAQSAVVREVRRARLFRRPIAVLALNPQPVDEEESLDRFTQEFRAELVQQYISAKAAGCLSTHLRSCDILTQSNKHFFALLPELNRDEALELARQMQGDLSSELGLNLKVGISMFPEDEVTATGLLERAEAEEAEIELVRETASFASENIRPLARPNTTHVSEQKNGKHHNQKAEPIVR